jgi:hypothetical protein
MKIGFTGTRKGMTLSQKEAVTHILKLHKASALQKMERYEFHHGGCVGADTQAHDIAWDLGYYIVLHPPIEQKHVGIPEGEGTGCARCLPRAEYLKRNATIVSHTDMMLATPWQEKQPIGKRGQGTWWTVRFAKECQKPITIISPNRPE